MKTVLSIAGSDSCGGAGVQQDLKTFTAYRLHGASVIAAVTAQNTLGVQEVFVLPLDIIEAQIDSVMSDLKPSAVKTGMLANTEIIDLVRRKIKQYRICNLVVDPVMVSTSGDRLLEGEAVSSMKKFVKAAKLSTPNIYEAEILSGVRVETERDMELAASKLGDCVVKGGHLYGMDILCFEDEIYRFPTKELKDVRLHGTGCAFSAAIASGLALGFEVPKAVAEAKDFMDSIISRNYSPGSGLRVIDTAGIRLGVTYEDSERDAVVQNVEDAVYRFIASKHSHKLMPEVGVNIAMALDGTKVIDEVAGVSGRLVRCGRRVIPVGFVMFGGSSHIGRVILTAMKSAPEKRAAMNIRFSEGILGICEKLGLSISSFSRKKQPEDTPTMEWGTSEAIKKLGGIPDIIYDKGAIGKEAMIRILGIDAVSVVELAVRIAERL
ncbi:MAG: bifunctional hydroxymethylpyrimidine kinase/phosphomethylpyrimidine kinase [Candidatus Altiarchaeota archaeon]|nr:bifunctional hydroxymethylpyrimidine kinase/phosphomethylpyrimidine kinase [Candidatus Altiarchaeota archaeon]